MCRCNVSKLMTRFQKIFCSGGNLDFFRQHVRDPLAGYKVSLLMHDTAARLRRLPLVSACHVDGRAIGGGAEIALWTDFRSFAPAGQLMFVEARMGLATGFSGAVIVQCPERRGKLDQIDDTVQTLVLLLIS